MWMPSRCSGLPVIPVPRDAQVTMHSSPSWIGKLWASVRDCLHITEESSWGRHLKMASGLHKPPPLSPHTGIYTPSQHRGRGGAGAGAGGSGCRGNSSSKRHVSEFEDKHSQCYVVRLCILPPPSPARGELSQSSMVMWPCSLQVLLQEAVEAWRSLESSLTNLVRSFLWKKGLATSQSNY